MDRATLVKGLLALGLSQAEADRIATEKLFDDEVQKGITTQFGVITAKPGSFVVESKDAKREGVKGYEFWVGKAGPFHAVGTDPKGSILAVVKKFEVLADSLFHMGREHGTKVYSAPK